MKNSNKKFEKLFKSAEDWHNNACLNLRHHDPQFSYSIGYKEAASFLAQHAADIGMQDLFVYPIAFLYRHHLELLLKLIVHTGNLLLDEDSENLHNHNLGGLWQAAKNIMMKIWTGADEPEEFYLIKHIVNEYIEWDNTSQAFRYPKDKNGKLHLENIRHINLRHLAETIDPAANFLESVYTGIEDFL